MKWILTLFILIFSNLVMAEEVIRIFGWENYLDFNATVAEAVSVVENKCDAHIAYDTYSSYSDFLNGVGKADYDIVIASSTFFESIMSRVAKKPTPGLDEITKDYNKHVRAHYLQKAYPPNVTYFLHSLTGFLVNTNNIKLSKAATIIDLLEAAGDKYEILFLDDPIEVAYLIEKTKPKAQQGQLNAESLVNNIKFFNSLISSKRVTIIDFFNKRLMLDNFGAAMTWSGDALIDIETIERISPASKKNLQLMVYPELSYVSSDLLVQFQRKPKADCVMRALSQPKFLNLIADETHYFSPFTKAKMTGNTNLNNKMQNYLLSYIDEGNWLDSTKIENLDEINYEWQKVKLNVIRSNAKNKVGKAVE